MDGFQDISDTADARGSRSNRAFCKIWFVFCGVAMACALLSGAMALLASFAIVFLSLGAFQLLGIYAALGSESYHWRVLKSLIAISLYLFALGIGLLPSFMISGNVDFFESATAVVWILAHLAFVTQTLLFPFRLFRGWQFHASEEARSDGFKITDMLIFTFCVALSFASIERFAPENVARLSPQDQTLPSLYVLVYFFTFHIVSGIIPLAFVFKSSTTESGCLSLFCCMFFVVLAFISLSSVIWVSMGDKWEGFMITTSFAGAMAIITTAITATVFSVLRERRFVLTSFSS